MKTLRLICRTALPLLLSMNAAVWAQTVVPAPPAPSGGESGEEIVFSPADDYVRRFVQKVDYARALSVRSIFRRAPVNGQPAPIEPCAHRGDQGASNGVAPTEPVSIDVDAALGASFSLLSRHKSLEVTDGGVPVGTLDRHAAFSAMARSVQ